MSRISRKITKRLEKDISELKEEIKGITIRTEIDEKYNIETHKKIILNIYLSDFDKDSTIQKDLNKYNIKEVHFEVKVDENFPFAPPFLRIVKPRFLGYVGFITSGGSLCLDTITEKHWSPAMTLSMLFVTIHEFIKDGKIDPNRYNLEYTFEEAEKQYKYTSKVHGWDKKI